MHYFPNPIKIFYCIDWWLNTMNLNVITFCSNDSFKYLQLRIIRYQLKKNYYFLGNFTKRKWYFSWVLNMIFHSRFAGNFANAMTFVKGCCNQIRGIIRETFVWQDDEILHHSKCRNRITIVLNSHFALNIKVQTIFFQTRFKSSTWSRSSKNLWTSHLLTTKILKLWFPTKSAIN